MSGSIDIASLPAATKANLTDIYPGTQGAIGPGTGTTRGVTLAQLLAPTSADSQNTIALSPYNINRAFSANQAQVLSQWSTNVGGGTSGNVAFNGRFYTSISGAPNQYIWSILGAVDYSGTGGAGQHVGVYGQGIRRTQNGGGTSANPEIWAGVFESIDLSNTVSSLTNSQLAVEIDLRANAADDANKRQIMSLVGSKAQTGVAPSISTGLGIWATDGTSIKDGINLNFPFTHAALNFLGTTQTSGHLIWLGNGKDIAFDTAGSNTVKWNTALFTAAGGLQFSGKVEMDSDVYIPNGPFTVGGLSSLAGGALLTGNFVFATNAGLQFTNQSNAASAQTATLLNSPIAGNPNFWVPVAVNGVTRYIPTW